MIAERRLYSFAHIRVNPRRRFFHSIGAAGQISDAKGKSKSDQDPEVNRLLALRKLCRISSNFASSLARSALVWAST